MVNTIHSKNDVKKLQKQYEVAMEEFYLFLKTDNRKESDKKFAEAQQILNVIERLNATQ